MFTRVVTHLNIIWISVSLIVISTFFTGCGPVTAEKWPMDKLDMEGGGGGGGEIVLEIPVKSGRELMCVQGVGGSFSHSDTSTFYDIDLDTSNVVDEEVYAPISGIAHVHTESATSGFGYHVSIDLGDGTYVVVSHLTAVFIEDGEEVAVGQLIGYEGCTGYCTGDHIHVGLHEGSASQTADHGVSIPTLYRTVDASHGGEVDNIASEDFVCGIEREGDPEDGHFYESLLETNLWHPDGTLVKTPDNAKVYVIEDGVLRWIENEDVFWSRGYDFDNVALISEAERDCHGVGSSIDSSGFVQALFDTEEQLWLLVGSARDSDRYRAPVRAEYWEDIMASWGLDYDQSNWPQTYADSSAYLEDWPPSANDAMLRDGTLVTEESSSAVYRVSNATALPIKNWETFLLQGYLDHAMIVVDDGAVKAIHGDAVGNCSSGIWCIDQEVATYCGGGLELDSGGEYGGEGASDQEDDQDSGQGTEDEEEIEQDAQDEEDEDEGEEDESEEEDEVIGDESHCFGEDACVADLDSDAISETLLLIEDQWTSASLDGLPAFIYANGGCFDGSLTTSDLMYANSDGYYEVDFSGFAMDCTVEMTLISSVGTDGDSPETDMSNWYWWQNSSFCATGQSLCELQENGTSWEEWLLSLSWDPSDGLSGDGNGYTSNSQL